MNYKKNNSFDLSFYSKTPKNSIKVISENTKLENPIEVKASITNSIELDWLIVCLKEYQYAEAKECFLNLISPKTQIAAIRNGYNLKASLIDFAKEEKIIECMINCPTNQIKMVFMNN